MSRTKSAGLSRRVTEVVEPFIDRGELAGVVALAATPEKILNLTTIGYADIARRQEMQPETMFWIASQTKSITCTALMMLVDEGKVDVEAPIAEYLPEFKNIMVAVEQDEDHVLLRRPDHPIKVREALSHTAGLNFASPVETPTLDRLPLDIAVRSYAAMPLSCQPGTRYQYANVGTNTIGRIIEVVGGHPYEKFLQERLLSPLGMKDTTFWPSKEQCQRLARSYRPNAAKTALEELPIGQLQYPLWKRTTRFPMPAGGLFATVTDVLRFCWMILNRGVFRGRRYLSEAAVAQMTTKQTARGIADAYGFGWGIAKGACLHGGAYGTEMVIDFTRGMIRLWCVQQCGVLGKGDQCRPAFHRVVTAVA